MRVLVTGGAGFIGSHTCVELLQRNFSVCVLDNLCNSNIKSLEIVQEIGNKELTFIEGDIRDSNILDKAFTTFNPQMVIHFAGLKAVGESVEQPSKYYSNNFHGTLNLVEAMTRHNTKKLVFSSSCTVYGPPEFVPITEQAHLHPSSPYGRSKHMAEIMLNDLTASDPDWGVISLRYFNPVGAHPSGLIGEDPKGIPNNLFPYITQVALRKLDHLKIFGNDYDTKDGTGVRDYIHVVDLAKGHICALDFLNSKRATGYDVGQLIYLPTIIAQRISPCLVVFSAQWLFFSL